MITAVLDRWKEAKRENDGKKGRRTGRDRGKKEIREIGEEEGSNHLGFRCVESGLFDVANS